MGPWPVPGVGTGDTPVGTCWPCWARTLAAAISHLSEKTGYRTYQRQGKVQERDTYSEAPRGTGRLWVPRRYEALHWDLVLSGRPYTVERLRCATGRWRAHVSFTPSAPDAACVLGRGVVCVDLNPHGVAVANVGRDGNPQPWPDGLPERLGAEAAASLHPYAGGLQVGAAPGRMWLHAPEMWQAGADPRAYRIGVVAKPVVDAALEAGRPLAREDLGFTKGTPTARSTGTAAPSRTSNWRRRSTGGRGGAGYPWSWWTPRTRRWRVGGGLR